MKTIVLPISLLFCFLGAVAYAGDSIPGVDITVRQGAKAVKQLKTDLGGNFNVGTLPPGAYTFEFRSKTSAALQKNEFSIAISGTKRPMTKSAIAGSKFAGGIAINVEVAAGAKVSGKVTTGHARKMVYVPPQLGSHMPGHYVEEGSAEAVEARATGRLSTKSVQDIQSQATSVPGN